MADNYNVEVTFTGINRMSAATNTITNDLNRVKRGVDDVDRGMGGLERNINRVRQALDIGIAGAMLGRINQFSQEFYELGASVDAAERTFQALVSPMGDTVAIMGRLRTATGGVISDLTLIEGANKLASMGLAANADEMERLLQMAVRLGGAMGTDATQSIQDFAAMLANESIPRLDTFGISSGRVRQRIDELLESGQALTRSDAFRMAVLEEGASSLERLGDAASAAETPLARFQTLLDNIFQQGAQNFAIGVNAIIGYFYAVGDATERTRREIELLQSIGVEAQTGSEALGGFNLFSGGAAITALFNPQVTTGATDAQRAAAQQVMILQDQLNAALRQGAGFIREQIRAYRQRAEAAEAAVVAEQRIAGLQANIMGPTSSLGQLFERFGGTTGFDMFGGVTADIQFFDPQWLGEVGDQLRNVTDSLEVARQLNEDGILSDDQLANFERAAERADAIARAAQAGAEAFENMSLAQALGEGGGDPLLSDVNAAILQELSQRGILDEDALQAASDTFRLASGEITQSSLTWRDSVVPALARVTERLGAREGSQRAQQVEDFMRNAALMGLDPNSMAYSLGLNLSTGTLFGGGVDFQSALQPLVDNIDFIRNEAAPQMAQQMRDAPGPTQAIQDVEKLGKVLDDITKTPFDVTVNINVNDPLGILSGGARPQIADPTGQGAYRSPQSVTVTRNQMDMRGRSTTNNRMTVTR